MNRTSDRETRLVALETRIQEIADRQDILAATMEGEQMFKNLLLSLCVGMFLCVNANAEKLPMFGAEMGKSPSWARPFGYLTPVSSAIGVT
jgi:hypothetical protein